MRKTWRFTVAILLILALSLPAPAAKKKPKIPLLVNTGVTAELASPPAGGVAQRCENWVWAASVEAILRSQDVPLDQRFWVQKSDGGEICLESLAPLDQIARVINGEYVLGDGRKVRLEARYTVGAPVNLDSVILGLRAGRPALLIWKGHAYVLYGVVYDELVSPTGHRLFDIRELKLVDPLYDDESRLVSFVKDQDDTADLGGTLEISPTFITPTDWMHRDK